MSRKDTKHLPLTQEAKAIDEMAWRGNVTPAEWYKWLLFAPDSRGVCKTDYIACMILSEIVYWYRGAEVVKGGIVVPGVRSRKFEGDILKKSYGELVEKFGLTKRQVVEAVLRLENAGVIRRVLRNIKVKGRCVNNVLYIQIFPDRLKEITYDVPKKHTGPSPSPEGQAPLPLQRDTLSLSRGTPSPSPEGYKCREYCAESTNKEEHPKSFASEGLPDSIREVPLATTATEDEPTVPEELSSAKLESAPAASVKFPRLPGGLVDFLGQLRHDHGPLAAALESIYTGFRWDLDTARQAVKRITKGTLDLRKAVLLSRYIQESHDVSDNQPPDWKPGNMKDLLNNLAPTLAAVRAYVQASYIDPLRADLRSTVNGDPGMAQSSYGSAQRLLEGLPKSATPREIFEHAATDFTRVDVWALRMACADRGLYHTFTETDKNLMRKELGENPYILEVTKTISLDPVKVFGFSAEEIAAFNTTAIAACQARITEIESLL